MLIISFWLFSPAAYALYNVLYFSMPGGKSYRSMFTDMPQATSLRFGPSD